MRHRSGGLPWWDAPWWGVPWWDVPWNLYPNSEKSREKVEKTSPAVRKSLPKTGKTDEMGRETNFHLPEISTQIAKNPGKRYRKQQHNKNEKENCL